MRATINAVVILALVALSSGSAQAPAAPGGGPCYVYQPSTAQQQLSMYCQNGSLAQLSVQVNGLGTGQSAYAGGAVTFWKPNPAGGGLLVTSFGSTHNFVDGQEGQSADVPYPKPDGTWGTLIYTRGLLTAVR